jgi:hypothetical protein
MVRYGGLQTTLNIVENKGNVVPSITVHFNGYVEASMQGHSKGSVGPFLTEHYKG